MTHVQDGGFEADLYDVDDRDRVVELEDVPPPCTGAPMPQLVCDEHRAVLAYHVRKAGPTVGTTVRMVDGNTEDTPIALVRFSPAFAKYFGPPNDEAFSGHPLAGRGLSPYGVFEVRHSSWLRRLERMNSVHPSHDRKRYLANRRHFIFTFHDSTFECIARELEYAVVGGSLRALYPRMIEELERR